MSLLTDVDNKVLGRQTSPAAQARQAWGRKHGWAVFLLLGVAALVVAIVLPSTNRPLDIGIGFVAAGLNFGLSGRMFFRRDRS